MPTRLASRVAALLIMVNELLPTKGSSSTFTLTVTTSLPGVTDRELVAGTTSSSWEVRS